MLEYPMEYIILYTIVFVFGMVIGSFLNVCIYRIPDKKNITTERSHCMCCGNVLKWYELIPVFSFLLQRGKCRHCGCRIAPQYPAVEAANAILYIWVFALMGFTMNSVISCLCVSALLVISMIDIRTFEIPPGCNLFIMALGLVHMALEIPNWYEYVIGFFAASGFFCLIYMLTKGRGIGGGDIKLLAAAGLLLGWQKIVLAAVLACVIGSVTHIILMKVRGRERVLAFGPYLSIGILAAMLYGEGMIARYLSFYR